jgi:catechol 2,3-dioxygenase-like lactoylglutathione lyase family enzyme
MTTIDKNEARVEIASCLARIEQRLEVVLLPVSNVDRAKTFYGRLGWRLDADFRFDNGFRVVQFTPPGSACSIQFGSKITSAAPGSVQGTYLIVSDIEAAHSKFVECGIAVSAVFHPKAPGDQFQPEYATAHLSGPAKDHASYGSFATFSDPDGNVWLLQEVTKRLPGRVEDTKTAYASTNELTNAIERAAAAHKEHEKQTGQSSTNWTAWFAEYMTREQTGWERLQ